MLPVGMIPINPTNVMYAGCGMFQWPRDKCLLHAKLMSTTLTQLLIFGFSYLLTNKRDSTMY